MWVEKRHHAFIKSQASTKAYAKSSSNPIRGGKYLLDHLIHFPANARLFLRVNFLVSAADSLCDFRSVILPLGCRCNFHSFPCISKQASFCSVVALCRYLPCVMCYQCFLLGEHRSTWERHPRGMGVLGAWGVLSPKQGLYLLQPPLPAVGIGEMNISRGGFSPSAVDVGSVRAACPP